MPLGRRPLPPHSGMFRLPPLPEASRNPFHRPSPPDPGAGQPPAAQCLAACRVNCSLVTVPGVRPEKRKARTRPPRAETGLDIHRDHQLRPAARRRAGLRHPPGRLRGEYWQEARRDRFRGYQPGPGGRLPGARAAAGPRPLADRGHPPCPGLELRRGPQPDPRRSRAGEHHAAPALRHRPGQAARTGGRGNRARHGQKAEAGARHPQNDRKHPATGNRQPPEAPGDGHACPDGTPEAPSGHESALQDAGQAVRAPDAPLNPDRTWPETPPEHPPPHDAELERICLVLELDAH